MIASGVRRRYSRKGLLSILWISHVDDGGGAQHDVVAEI
jgi:hypothetical protein